MAEFKHGQRVRYTGTITPVLIGQEGTFSHIGRNGWAVVDFDKHGECKVAQENLQAIADDGGRIPLSMALNFAL